MDQSTDTIKEQKFAQAPASEHDATTHLRPWTKPDFQFVKLNEAAASPTGNTFDPSDITFASVS